MSESHALVDEAGIDRPRTQPRVAGDAYEAPAVVDSSLYGVAGIQAARPLVRDAMRRRVLALFDLVALCAAYGVVWFVDRPDSPFGDKLILAAALPVWLLLNKLLGLYDRDANLINKSTLDELPRIIHSAVLGSALVYLLVPVLPGMHVGRSQTIVFLAAACASMTAGRGLARFALRRRLPAERCLIVGSGAVAQLLVDKIAAHPEYGVELVGFIDEAWHAPEGRERVARPSTNGPPRLGDIAEFEQLCRSLHVDRVVIAFSSMSHEELLNVVGTSKRLSVKITIVPRLFEAIGHAVELDHIEGLTLLGLRGLTRSHSALMLKRAIDLAGAGFGLLLLSPALALIALAIKLSSSGPVLFKQRRVGRAGESFTLYKFRTMYRNADQLKPRLEHLNEASQPMFKMSADPRVTRVGRLLRRYSIDELPQLWNVLRGEMSLVGPRPLIPTESDQVIGRHRARLQLTPGLSGPWQVMGRTTIPFEQMVKIDYLYVAEWSNWNDLKVLMRTVPVVLRGAGQ